MSKLLAYLKKNWLNILLAIIGTVGGADAVAGMRDGKSATNVMVIPSLIAAAGSTGILGIRWLNNRTVTTKVIRDSLDSDFMSRLENLYSLARDPDISADQATHLADIAGDLLLAEYRRANKNRLASSTVRFGSLSSPMAGPSQVVPQFPVQTTTTTQEAAR